MKSLDTASSSDQFFRFISSGECADGVELVVVIGKSQSCNV